MSLEPNRFRTGGALQGAAAASLLRERQRAAELKPDDRVGIYCIVSELGRGGMAIVYRAERADGEYEQQVALKWMLDPRPDAASEALFRRERQALADLRHPHIARLLDGGRSEDGRPWFAMELIEGQRVDEHCHAAALPLARRLALFAQVCSAVAFAHARGVIHRDIKPSNVLVDADGSVRLLDFGIAQLLDDQDSALTHAFTPGFASPEQQRGETLTVASDVYQLGLLLAAMLHKPESAIAATQLPPTGPPSADGADCPRIPSGLPHDLAAILNKALLPQARDRYASVHALAEDIRAFVDRRPVAARPRTASYRLQRFIQRHPWGSASAILATAILVATVSGFTLRLRAERDAAEYQARVASAVLDFLRNDLLAAADPGADPGRELSVRDALDSAAAAAGERFAEAPVELASIRTTLASLYLDLGRLDEGEREARAAFAIATEPERPAALRLAVYPTLLRALSLRGLMEEAGTLAEAWIHEARTGGDTFAEFSAEYSRAENLHARGRYAEAEALYADALDRISRSPVSRLKAQVAGFQAGRIDSLLMLGRQEEALSEASEMLASAERSYGPLHPIALTHGNRRGQVLRHMGRLDEAEAQLRLTLERRETVLGADHPDTLASSNELATVLQELQRFEQAEALFRSVLDARLRKLGEAHLYTRNSMSNLGLLYVSWNRPELAAPLYERTLAIERELLGEDHPDTISLMHNIAGLYRRQQRFDDAMAMHDLALERGQASLGESSWQVGMFRIGRGHTLKSMGNETQAASEYRLAIDILRSHFGDEHPRVQRAKEMLAELESGP